MNRIVLECAVVGPSGNCGSWVGVLVGRQYRIMLSLAVARKAKYVRCVCFITMQRYPGSQ